MNRRGMILTAFLSLLIPWRRSPRRIVYRELPLNEWLERTAAELPQLADAMANMESGAVRHWHPGEWRQMRYASSIPWRQGVSLLYGFGPPEESRPASIAARAALERAGVKNLGFGYSRDGRAWTVFALAECGDLCDQSPGGVTLRIPSTSLYAEGPFLPPNKRDCPVSPDCNQLA